MNRQLDQRTVLLMLVGCGTVYVAFVHPSFGTALVVGAAVVTLLHLLMRGRSPAWHAFRVRALLTRLLRHR